MTESMPARWHCPSPRPFVKPQASDGSFGYETNFHKRLPLLRQRWGNAGASPVPKLCQNAMFFLPLGLALSEKQIPQITENTEKAK